MPSQPFSLILVYCIASATGVLTALILWRRQPAAGSRPLAGMVLAAAFWALCDGVELSVRGVEAKRLVSQVQYLAVVSAAPFFFHAAMALSRLEKHLTRADLWAVWGIPVATLGVAWTSRWHTWLWTAITVPDPHTNIARYEYGWWFWILTAQHYLLMTIGTVVLLRAAGRVTRPFRQPMALVVVAVLLPWLGNIDYVFKLGPWPGLNWLSISIVLSGMVLAWSTLEGGLLDLLPLAREELVGGMADGVVVLDHQGRMLLRNPAAEQMFALQGEASLLPETLWSQELPAAFQKSWQGEMELRGNSGPRWLDVHSSAICDRWGEVAGRLLVFRDITARKALEKEKESLIAQLRTALDEVQTLEGLLPMCASCKKIRDDRGYWDHVESYLARHTNARFTHGICQECIQKLYPEVAARMARNDGEKLH